MPTTRPTRLAAAAALTLATVAVAGPAVAHVGVSSPDAARDGYGKVVFRVPTESDTADTTKLVVTLPADAPFLHLTAQTKPGWTITTREGRLPEPVEVDGTEITRAVRTVTWTADGDGIPPGEFDEFALSGGPFPDADSIRFEAEQTYSDGEVVDWDQVQQGDTEPDKPAPTLSLLPAGDGGHAHGGSAASDDAEEQEAATHESGGSDADVLGRVLGGAALVVALAALLGVLRQDRRRA